MGAIDHLGVEPQPPESARTLTLRIEAFVDPFPCPWRGVQLRGPWEFRVAL